MTCWVALQLLAQLGGSSNVTWYRGTKYPWYRCNASGRAEIYEDRLTLQKQALTKISDTIIKMYRVCSQLLVKSQRQLTRRRLTSQATRSEESADRRLQMQLDHDMAMKKLEYAQKGGLEIFGVSRDTANLLTVGGTTVFVVSGGAWFVSQLLADAKANTASVQRELATQSDNMRCFISGEHWPKEAETESQKLDSEKQS